MLGLNVSELEFKLITLHIEFVPPTHLRVPLLNEDGKFISTLILLLFQFIF